MNWYYSVGVEQKGPISEADLRRLVQDGIVTHQTLVWREGLPEWQPYSATGLVSGLSDTGTDPMSGVSCANCANRFSSSEVVSLGGRTYCAHCKPIVTQRLREGVGMGSAAEETRKKYINHESSVRSVGSFYVIVGAVMVAWALGVLVMADTASSSGAEFQFGCGFGLLGGMVFWIGLGIRRLKSWSRTPVGILSSIGLIAIPIGTLINGYILWLCFSQKGKFVFSKEYQAVIEQTRHIQRRTSLFVWILLGLLLGCIGLIPFGSILNNR